MTKGTSRQQEGGFLIEYANTTRAIVTQVGGPAIIQSVANCATRLRFVLLDEGTASLCVALKNKGQKQIASSAGFTTLMGITEPAMFGITVKYCGVLVSVMIGCLVGGFFAGITGVVRYSAGEAGIALLPCFIGESQRALRHPDHGHRLCGNLCAYLPFRL